MKKTLITFLLVCVSTQMHSQAFYHEVDSTLRKRIVNLIINVDREVVRQFNSNGACYIIFSDSMQQTKLINAHYYAGALTLDNESEWSLVDSVHFITICFIDNHYKYKHDIRYDISNRYFIDNVPVKLLKKSYYVIIDIKNIKHNKRHNRGTYNNTYNYRVEYREYYCGHYLSKIQKGYGFRKDSIGW